MNLITSEQQCQLLRNGRLNATRTAECEEPEDFRPAVKLWPPIGEADVYARGNLQAWRGGPAG